MTAVLCGSSASGLIGYRIRSRLSQQHYISRRTITMDNKLFKWTKLLLLTPFPSTPLPSSPTPTVIFSIELVLCQSVGPVHWRVGSVSATFNDRRELDLQYWSL